MVFRSVRTTTLLAAALVLPLAAAVVTAPAQAGGPMQPAKPTGNKPFERVATYPVYLNLPKGVAKDSETVAEIAGVSADGKTVVYTDSEGMRVGLVDITDPAAPKGLGSIDLTAKGDAEPTSVTVVGDNILVVVNTSTDYVNTSGRLDVYSLKTRSLKRSFELGGQPDAIAVSPDQKYAAIAIENERDEDLTPPNMREGDLPQMPAGFVQVVDLGANVADWKVTKVALTRKDGRSLPALENVGIDTPIDPEPEYVAIQNDNIAAVSLQENNGLVMIDLKTKKIINAFGLGKAIIGGVDTTKDGLFNAVNTIIEPREPDAIAWIDDTYVATANEGDWKGGSRGWSIFNAKTGKLAWDAGNSFENLALRYGFHNNSRAAKKGNEPEGIATATYNGVPYAFVGSERSNFIGVYDMRKPTSPQFLQVLPTTNGPEGLLPIPGRKLFVVASEVDDAKEGIRSTLQVYKMASGNLDEFPSLYSARNENCSATGCVPIGWGALSGLAADRSVKGKLYAVNDSAFAHGRIYTIKARKNRTAYIMGVQTVTKDGKPMADLDLEGIATRSKGGFWLASEAKKPAQNKLIRTNRKAQVQEVVTLPQEVTDRMGKWGIEGVTVVGSGSSETVYFVLQRPLWNNVKKKSDPVDGEHIARIGKYHVASGEFTWFGYELEKTTQDGDWIGLSEVEAVDSNTLAIVERDKKTGPDAKVKRVYTVKVPDTGASTTGLVDGSEKLKVLPKTLLVDSLPALRSTNGWTQEKLEGFAIDSNNAMYGVTDNDGVKDATGETVFMHYGQLPKRLR